MKIATVRREAAANTATALEQACMCARVATDHKARDVVVLDMRGITLVAICPGMPEMRGRPDAAPDSFARLFRSDSLPDWLVPKTLPGAALQVYAVTR